MLSLDDIQDILRIKLIGVIPESEAVLDASNQGVPVIHIKGTDVSESYKDLVERFLGRDCPDPIHRSGQTRLLQARLRRQVM